MKRSRSKNVSGYDFTPAGPSFKDKAAGVFDHLGLPDIVVGVFSHIRRKRQGRRCRGARLAVAGLRRLSRPPEERGEDRVPGADPVFGRIADMDEVEEGVGDPFGNAGRKAVGEDDDAEKPSAGSRLTVLRAP